MAAEPWRCRSLPQSRQPRDYRPNARSAWRAAWLVSAPGPQLPARRGSVPWEARSVQLYRRRAERNRAGRARDRWGRESASAGYRRSWQAAHVGEKSAFCQCCRTSCRGVDGQRRSFQAVTIDDSPAAWAANFDPHPTIGPHCGDDRLLLLRAAAPGHVALAHQQKGLLADVQHHGRAWARKTAQATAQLTVAGSARVERQAGAGGRAILVDSTDRLGRRFAGASLAERRPLAIGGDDHRREHQKEAHFVPRPKKETAAAIATPYGMASPVRRTASRSREDWGQGRRRNSMISTASSPPTTATATSIFQPWLRSNQ